MKYYLDTCIWIDYLENRSDKFRPLGDWALELINKIIKNDSSILYSDLVEKELFNRFSKEKIKEIFNIMPIKIFIKVESFAEQIKESINISRKLNIPRSDALHAILARDNKAILVSRDKHFYELQEQVEIKKPEELI